jgi:hypothetical protein
MKRYCLALCLILSSCCVQGRAEERAIDYALSADFGDPEASCDPQGEAYLCFLHDNAPAGKEGLLVICSCGLRDLPCEPVQNPFPPATGAP